MIYADIHIHILSGVDDGAETKEEMYRMLDMAYADGTRYMCLTPHFHPGYFGENSEKVLEVFKAFCEEAKQKYPDLQLCLGNELQYQKGCIAWLEAGRCRTMNGSQLVLVDFGAKVKEKEIVRGMESLLNAGYVPILAHAERYSELRLSSVKALKQKGVLIQMDAQAPWGAFGFGTQQRSRAILAERLVDIVSSDAHDCKGRPPVLSKCYRWIEKKLGAAYAEQVCYKNAVNLLKNWMDGEE